MKITGLSTSDISRLLTDLTDEEMQSISGGYAKPPTYCWPPTPPNSPPGSWSIPIPCSPPPRPRPQPLPPGNGPKA
jgi:bacteriocin-like protein